MASHDPLLSGVKTCTKCGVPKPVIHFSVHKSCKDGLEPWCRECVSTYSRGKKREKKGKGEGRMPFLLKDWSGV